MNAKQRCLKFVGCIPIFLMLYCNTLLFAQGSSKNVKFPVWIEKPYAAHSQKDYIAVTAQGLSRQLAIDNAYGELAKIFGTDVKLDARMEERLKETSDKVEVNRNMSQNILVSAKHNVVNAIVAETWQNPSDKKHYALVTLHKADTARVLYEQIQEFLAVIEQYIILAENESDPLFSYSYMDLASIFALKIEAPIRQLQVLDPSAKINNKFNPQLLVSKTKQLLKNISFEVEKENIAEFYQTVLNKLSDLGFRSDSAAPYLIKGSVNYQDRPPANGYYFVDGVVLLQIVDKKENAILTTFIFNAREAGYTLESSFGATARRLKNEIDDTFLSQFDNYLNMVLTKKN